MGCFKEMSIDWMQDCTNHWEVVALRDVSGMGLEEQAHNSLSEQAPIEELLCFQQQNESQLNLINELLG